MTYTAGVVAVYRSQAKKTLPVSSSTEPSGLSLYSLLSVGKRGWGQKDPEAVTFLDPKGVAGTQVLVELLSKPPSGPPPMPQHSFIITVPTAVRSGRLEMALENIAAAGLPLPRVIYGSYINDTDVGCRFNAKYSCRLGLIQAQAQAWRVIEEEGLESAWVFEDDVLFHDEFAELWPLYWSKVPPWYEIVYTQAWAQEAVVAQQLHSIPYTVQKEPVVFDIPTWGAGAYVLSRHGAARLYARYLSLLYHNLKGPSNEQGSLTPFDITPDDFLVTHGLKTRPVNKSHVIFQNTEDEPAMFAGLTLRPEQLVNWYNCKQHGCTCDDEPSEACAHFLPVVFHGLSFQHFHCSTPQAFWKWVKYYKEHGPKEGVPQTQEVVAEAPKQ